MSSQIPVFIPTLGIDTVKAVTDAFDIGWLGMGATTQTFERRIAEYLELRDRFVLTTNTGTAALHLALLGAEVGAGDEVIVPSFNFIADIQAIVATGATPVFCDIEEDTLGLDVAQAQNLITDRTKAILPLHFAGIPCDIDGIHSLAAEHDLRVIEDATHAFGTRIRGRPIGGIGDFTCFSFDPVKIITSIDGGAVIVPDADALERLRHMRLLGIDKDTTERYKNRRAWDYDVVSIGFRYHLTNINAAIGLSQLARVDEFIANRQRCCRRYNERLGEIDAVTVPTSDYIDVSPFIYTIRVPVEQRMDFIEHLCRRGIDAGIHFLPCHSQPFCREFPCGDMTVTERVTSRIVTLPLHSAMTLETVDQVADAVCSFAFRRIAVESTV